jgi:hypothetical protein
LVEPAISDILVIVIAAYLLPVTETLLTGTFTLILNILAQGLRGNKETLITSKSIELPDVLTQDENQNVRDPLFTDRYGTYNSYYLGHVTTDTPILPSSTP